MVGVLLSVVDSHTCPCLCVDAMPTISVNLNKHLVRRGGTMELSSSFVEPVREWRSLCVNRTFKKKQRRDYHRRVPIVNELGGQYNDNFDDVKTFRCNKQPHRRETFYTIPCEGATRPGRESDGNTASPLW